MNDPAHRCNFSSEFVTLASLAAGPLIIILFREDSVSWDITITHAVVFGILIAASVRRASTNDHSTKSAPSIPPRFHLSLSTIGLAAVLHLFLGHVLIAPTSSTSIRDSAILAAGYGAIGILGVVRRRSDGRRREVLLRKRFFDVILASVMAPLLFIAIVPISLLVLILDRRFPFYSQTRLGRFRKPFRLIKIRTMTDDPVDPKRPRWTSIEDPRVTPLGRLLRRLHIDELPQIWNVLRGDLSFVGPRPERPEFAEVFAGHLPKYQNRHSVPTGITGLAQVEGFAGNSSLRRRLRCDLFYVRHVSLCFDIRIILLTVMSTIKTNHRKQYDFDPDRDTNIP